jgi:signal-transduction protein with cAMP-binding, CBS, and nucleotidyltransferase domain
MKTTTVRDWMNDLVVYVEPEATVTEALSMMRRRYIHSLIVSKTDSSPEYGIITSTDICDKIVAQDRNPSQTKVLEVMNSPLIVVQESVGLTECALIMREKKIHHLPVVNSNGVVVGMISDTDFLVVAEAMGRAPGEWIV